MPLDAAQMTSSDAARELGVSMRQVQRLADSGELIETGRVGGSLLIDTASVHRLAQRGSQRGRPWSEETTWAALELLDTGTTTRLTAAQRSRLRVRLRGMDVEEFVRLARRRAEVHRFRASSSALQRLRGRLTLTGESALDADRAVAAGFGLAGGGNDRPRGRTVSRHSGAGAAPKGNAVLNGNVAGNGYVALDGYVERARLQSYCDEFFLTGDWSGNTTLRAVSFVVGVGEIAGDCVVSLDLAESLDPRQSSAGRRRLAERLDQI